MVIETPHETVYVIEDWYDGPRSGYADYQQKPHFFRSLHLDGDHYTYDEDRFELTPVSAQVVAWAVESDQLWRRWNEAYRAGTLTENPNDDVRILPEDRAYDQELRSLIERFMNTQAGTKFVVRGKVEPGCDRVQWYEINA